MCVGHNMNRPRNRLFFRRRLEAIHLRVHGPSSSEANCFSRKMLRLLTSLAVNVLPVPTLNYFSRRILGILKAARLFFDEAILRIRRGFLKAIKRTINFWSLLRRSQIISWPLFLVGAALTTFLHSTQFIDPENLMIAIRSCALGMLACSTLAYAFAIAFARVESSCS